MLNQQTLRFYIVSSYWYLMQTVHSFTKHPTGSQSPVPEYWVKEPLRHIRCHMLLCHCQLHGETAAVSCVEEPLTCRLLIPTGSVQAALLCHPLPRLCELNKSRLTGIRTDLEHKAGIEPPHRPFESLLPALRFSGLSCSRHPGTIA